MIAVRPFCIVSTSEDNPIGALDLEGTDGVIQTVDLITNPDKLTGLRALETTCGGCCGVINSPA